MEIEDEETKQSLYSGSYEENLDQFLSLFVRKPAENTQRSRRGLPNPLTWNPYYLAKRKCENPSISSGRKKVKASGNGNSHRGKVKEKAGKSEIYREIKGK